MVADNPVAGDQAYVDAPEAVKDVEPPLHIETLATLIVGNGFGVTVIPALVAVHEPKVAEAV